MGQAGTSVEPKSLSLRLLFLMIFLHTPHEAISALRMLNMLNMPIHSLGNNLALNLSTVMPTASWVMWLTFPVLPCFNIHGAFFLAQCPSIDVYNFIFLVDLHVCGQRNHPMFPERPTEPTVSASPLSLCIGPFTALLAERVSCL